MNKTFLLFIFNLVFYFFFNFISVFLIFLVFLPCYNTCTNSQTLTRSQVKMIVISRLNQKSGLVICLVVALAFFSYYGLWEKLQGGTSYVRFSPNYLWTNSNLFGVREQDDIKVILYFDKLFNSPWSFM